MNKKNLSIAGILCVVVVVAMLPGRATAQVDTSSASPADSSTAAPGGGLEPIVVDVSDTDAVTEKCKTEYSQASYQVCEARPVNPGSWANQEECKAALIKACIDSENAASTEKKKAARGPYVPSQVGGLNKFGFSNVTIGIARLAKAIIGVIGSIALAMFVYGGFVWMTSRGNSEQVSKAIKTMVWSALGIVVILTSYAIVDFLFSIFG